MIVVHHLENSRSQRVLWLLEELGVPYEVKRYERDRQTLLAPAALRQVHPLGKSPVITDGEHTIAESGAIIEYLIDHYGDGKLKPAAGTPASGQYTYWLHYAEGSLMPLLVMTLVFLRIPKSPMPFFVKPIARALSGKVRSTFLQPQIEDHLAMIEQHLQHHTWFAGDELSGADIQMSFPLEAAAARANASERFPAINAFLERIHGRDAWQRALEKGGPYEILGG